MMDEEEAEELESEVLHGLQKWISKMKQKKKKSQNSSSLTKKRKVLYLNKASEKSLLAVCGLGPVKVELLLKKRPFKSWEQVQDLHGFGPDLIANMHAHPILFNKEKK